LKRITCSFIVLFVVVTFALASWWSLLPANGDDQGTGYYTLTIKAWTESGRRELTGAYVEVNYRRYWDGQWVEYEKHLTPDSIRVARGTRVHVFLRRDPYSYSYGQFLYWDNYGIARGSLGDRSCYLDMNGDRTIVATYRY